MFYFFEVLYIRGIIFGIGMNGDWSRMVMVYHIFLGILNIIEQVLICDDFSVSLLFHAQCLDDRRALGNITRDIKTNRPMSFQFRGLIVPGQSLIRL